MRIRSGEVAFLGCGFNKKNMPVQPKSAMKIDLILKFTGSEQNASNGLSKRVITLTSKLKAEI